MTYLPFLAVLILCHFISSATAHMIMANPVPYGKSTLNNSPLSSDGSDYPCKLRPGAFEVSSMNNIKVGEPQTLSFSGTAVHGGGSCQLAITLDKEPNKNSKFKVIHSIIGGCPGVGDRVGTFPYTLPASIPNGEATIAWTWFNKIGNREMYMNCAPIAVTGGASDSSEFDKLPDMFIANLAFTSNKVSEGSDYSFPEPGKDVVFGSGASPLLPSGSSNPAVSPAPTVAPPVASSTLSPRPTTSGAVPAFSVTVPQASQGVTQPPVSNGSSCPTDGALVCNGATQFGLCNFGRVIWQPVAPGTQCSDGKITKRHAHMRKHARSFQKH